ncbi:IS21 family transposase [Clostridium sp. KNHs214]|uniref:IS21 family transposase n=1 Tax=Clostridium sp. KNHs214 TaxID=1540257 RepID=UPI00069040AC|nr:IS21 family transposase [Clostridium sp. KNHs214]
MINNLQGELFLMNSIGIKPNYAQLAKKYGMDWRTVKKYDQGYKGKPKTRIKKSKLDPYRVEITDKLAIRRITMKGVYEFMVDKHGINTIGTYSNFITYIKKNKLLPKQSNTGHPRYETKIGKQGQVDWKEDITLTSRSGEKYTINILHVTLSFSRYSYLGLSIQKKTDDVFRCLINSFEAFGGIPEELLFDNMSTVANVHGVKKKITETMGKFAKDFGFNVRLCGARKPETKGTVEAKNKVIDWIRAYDGEFDTLDNLLEKLKEINLKMNININTETGMSPTALFYKEKEYLHSLPKASIIDTYLSPNKYKVSNEALIRFGESKYSVHPKLINEEVSVDILDNKLYIYYKGKLVTFHSINKNPINYVPEHYTILMKGKVKAADLEAVANENLKLMDRLLESRKIDISNIEATKSPEALLAYMNGSPYGNWIIGQYAHMSKENRSTFIKGMNLVLPYVKNKEIFMSNLKFSVKNNWCKQLDYDCWINDFMAVCDAECILTDEGYKIIHNKYEKEIQEFTLGQAPGIVRMNC